MPVFKMPRLVVGELGGFSQIATSCLFVLRDLLLKKSTLLLKAFAASPAIGGRIWSCRDGALKKLTESQAIVCLSKSRFIFLDWRTDILRLWGNGLVSCSLQTSRGNPLCVMEAMASGLPF